MNSRADYGNSADAWFASLDDTIASVGAQVRSLILKSVPGMTECIKWGMPNYEKGGMVCALRAGKDYVALQFGAIGAILEDPDGLLEGTGKGARHVKIRSQDEIRVSLFGAWIQQAADAYK